MVQYRARQGMSAFRETEEAELCKVVFREFDEILQRSEVQLFPGRVC
jgi:hypothetical protein